jgi:hypothetical protein
MNDQQARFVTNQMVAIRDALRLDSANYKDKVCQYRSILRQISGITNEDLVETGLRISETILTLGMSPKWVIAAIVDEFEEAELDRAELERIWNTLG